MTRTLPVVNGIEFRVVPEFPDYALGSDGSVWSHRGFMDWRRMSLRWTGRKAKPYPAVYMSNDSGRRQIKIHRLMLEVFVGPCPAGMCAMHFPDPDTRNNAIANLKWGTMRENSRHCVDGGTWRGGDVRGERHPQSTITDADAVAIHGRLVAGESPTAVATSYGISVSTVRRIGTGRAWSHLRLPKLDLSRWSVHAGESNASAKLNEQDVRNIRQLYATGNHTQATIAKEYGITQNLVSKIVLRQLWKDV